MKNAKEALQLIEYQAQDAYDIAPELQEAIATLSVIVNAHEGLVTACEAAQVNAGKYEEWRASRIGATCDALSGDAKFSLKEFGFFDLLDEAKKLRAQLDDALALAKGKEEIQ